MVEEEQSEEHSNLEGAADSPQAGRPAGYHAAQRETAIANLEIARDAVAVLQDIPNGQLSLLAVMKMATVAVFWIQRTTPW